MAPNNNKSILKAIKQLGDITDILKREYSSISKDLIAEAKKTYHKEENPYGEAWPARKHNKPWPILNKTGNMLKSFKGHPRKDGYLLTNQAAYSGYHQFGTKNMAQRLFLPEASRGIPKSWQKLIQKKLNAALRKRLQKQ
jgi:phage gpG-like protein